MPSFKCKFITPGSRQIIEKEQIAESKEVLRKHLESDGNFVLELQPVEGIGSPLGYLLSRGRITNRDFFTFNQEFAVLLKAGLPIMTALDAIIEENEDGEFRRLLMEIREDISGGESLSASFAKHVHLFSQLYVATLQAGEKSGDITTGITRYLEYLRKTAEIKQKVIAASVYPAILTVVSVATLLFLMMYVVPVFTESFFDAGAQLPAITLLLMKISEWVKGGGIYFMGLLSLGIPAVAYMWRTKAGRMYFDRWKLHIPVIGEIYQQYAASKLGRTLSTIIGGGTPLVDSLSISQGVLENQFLSRQLKKAREWVEEGESFSDSLQKAGVMPSLAVRMVRAGEHSGALSLVLGDVAEYYEREVDNKLKILTSAIEPGLMVIMGFLIGFIVIAMYLPIFQLAGTVN